MSTRLIKTITKQLFQGRGFPKPYQEKLKVDGKSH
jgi:hypothetical protein